MGTWEQGNSTFECPHCGARYEAKWMNYPSRDKGVKICECCGQIVLEWDGTRDYGSFVLIEPGCPKPTKPKKRPRDSLALAKLVGDIATGQTQDNEPDNRNPAAVEMGRLGGKRGGIARAAKLSPEKRKEIAQAAARKRWSK